MNYDDFCATDVAAAVQRLVKQSERNKTQAEEQRKRYWDAMRDVFYWRGKATELRRNMNMAVKVLELSGSSNKNVQTAIRLLQEEVN